MAQYRQIIDKFALNTLIKQPNIPDFHLMVGSAEVLDSIPLLVYESAKVPTELVSGFQELKNNYSNEQLQQKIADNELEVNDLNMNLAFIGSGLGV